MARIYSSRLLLDPSVLQMANAAMQNRIANETGIRKWLGQSVGAGLQSALQNIGGAIDSGYQMYKNEKDQAYRRDQINNYMSEDQLSDPLLRAAAEEYVRTGDSGKMSQYILGRETAEARKLAAQKDAQDKADSKKLHGAVRAENARKSYADNLRRYNEAKTEAEKLQYKLANQALETEYGNIFGQTMDAYEEARNKDIAKSDLSFSNKQQFLANMPASSFRNENDRLVALATIKSAYDNEQLTKSDYQELQNTINGIGSHEKTRAKGTEDTLESIRKENIKENTAEVKAAKALAKKAKDKKAKGLLLFKDEQEALDKYGDKI